MAHGKCGAILLGEKNFVRAAREFRYGLYGKITKTNEIKNAKLLLALYVGLSCLCRNLYTLSRISINFARLVRMRRGVVVYAQIYIRIYGKLCARAAYTPHSLTNSCAINKFIFRK